MSLYKVLPVKKNKDNGFAIARVHYSLDPNKDKEWIKEAKRGMPERGWLREYEIDYSSYAGKPFFPEFSELNISKDEIGFVRGDIIYRGWDFGFHRPCVVITKLDQFDRWIIMDMVLGEDEGIFDFGVRIRRYCLSQFPGAKYIDACDPAGHQVSDKNEKTSVQILNNIGIYPQSRKQPITAGAEIIRQKLGLRADGKVGLLVNLDQNMIIDGFKGGIHYPESKEGKPEKEFYTKDGLYDHIFDALRYAAVEMFTIIGQSMERNALSMDTNQRDFAMGNPSMEEQYNQSTSLFDDGLDYEF